MFKKLGLIFIWLLITPSVLLTSGLFMHHISKNSQAPVVGLPMTLPEASLENQMLGEVLGTQIEDMRPYYVTNFLKNTKLEPYSGYMVEVSDKYDIDYRLIPAIAMKESGGGNAIKEVTHNAWGFGNGKTVFDSWPSAIDSVAKTLKERYIAKGLNTPEEIMPVYAPPQVETGGKWAKDINFLFSKLESL